MEEIRLVHFIIFILLIKELYFISFLMNTHDYDAIFWFNLIIVTANQYIMTVEGVSDWDSKISNEKRVN